MIDLTKTTFIIPVYIESTDRYRNAISVLGFLNHHFNTNVIIHELVEEETKLDFLSKLNNLNINHITEKFDGKFHRTRQLNEMLDITETPVVVNYDIDVLLPVETCLESQNKILDGVYDVIYPYEEGSNEQIRINRKYNRDLFNKTFDLNLIQKGKFLIDFDTWSTKCGHCLFLNTDKYKECGGENENFIAYGPEDSERYERFYKIDYNVGRVGKLVFHFEHYRTPTSNYENPFFKQNQDLYEKISKMSKDEVINYYLNVDYIKKYNFKLEK